MANLDRGAERVTTTRFLDECKCHWIAIGLLIEYKTNPSFRNIIDKVFDMQPKISSVEDFTTTFDGLQFALMVPTMETCSLLYDAYEELHNREEEDE